MKIVILGQSGAGKSLLARKIQLLTDIALLPLDFLWLATDYSEEAQQWFEIEQEKFMDEHDSWIIEGNYLATATRRIKEADKIILLRVPRYLAMYRVIKRSIKRKKDPRTRPDVPIDFSEKLDKDYWEFLSFVWHFKKKNEPKIIQLIETLQVKDRLIILNNKAEQQAFIDHLKKEKQTS
ncbi:topology modulation protein [Enterococcus villorum]|uniref:Topology modulation protein n=1 Tax=Enterococcus villorum TaxID=112904 RepID=A0A1V8Y7Z3_9ENTE|nr:topology modulation protein [Enterococcus villorum]OQO68741.1 topology modulation protein [Enterococcus villorum]OQO72300.1 topology modulation protein [Enterococcus villorum]